MVDRENPNLVGANGVEDLVREMRAHRLTNPWLDFWERRRPLHDCLDRFSKFCEKLVTERGSDIPIPPVHFFNITPCPRREGVSHCLFLIAERFEKCFSIEGIGFPRIVFGDSTPEILPLCRGQIHHSLANTPKHELGQFTPLIGRE